MSAKYLTPEQWAEERQLKLETVWRQIRQGRIRAIKEGRVYRIPVTERERYDRENAAA